MSAGASPPAPTSRMAGPRSAPGSVSATSAPSPSRSPSSDENSSSNSSLTEGQAHRSTHRPPIAIHPILQCFSDERVEAALFSQRFRTVSSQRRLVIGGAPLLPLIFGARPAVLLFVAVLIQACMSARRRKRKATM